MNSAHDLGGAHAFGVIPEPAPNAPNFHADWERRVMALTLAMGATASWNIDQSRAARESVPPAQYLSNSYFEIWFDGLQKLMLERGMVSENEIATGISIDPPKVLNKKLLAQDVAQVLTKGSPTERPHTTRPLFSVGQSVACKVMNPEHHTRLPRYVRGKRGLVEAVRGVHVFPDRNAQGFDEAQWLYTVRFNALDLWGLGTTASAVYVDCWESYLV